MIWFGFKLHTGATGILKYHFVYKSKVLCSPNNYCLAEKNPLHLLLLILISFYEREFAYGQNFLKAYGWVQFMYPFII